MRRVKQIILFLAALILFFVLICAFISLRYMYYSETEQNRIINGLQSTINAEYIYTDNSTEAIKAAKKINKFLENQPKNIAKDFFPTWKIAIAKDAASSRAEGVGGLTNWMYRIIIINTYQDSDYTYQTFIHEFGHYFDCSHGYCSQSPEFKKIYQKYKSTFTEKDQNIPKEYPTSNSEEFFAAVFKEYFLYPEHLSKNASEAYKYIQNIYNIATENNSIISKTKNNIMAYYYRNEDKFKIFNS